MTIDHSTKVIADLGKVLADVIHLAKHGVGIGSISQIFSLLSDAKDLIAETPLAVPELKSLTADETSQLAAASYDMVQVVIKSITA